MSRPGFDGEKNALATTSPMPFIRVPSAAGCDVSGMITRRMTLVERLTGNGITGWMLSSVAVASRSPRPKSQLPCNGTLIRLATGFWVCLASSSASCAEAAAGRSGNSAARTVNANGNRTAVPLETFART
jgi:hypothetical protein